MPTLAERLAVLLKVHGDSYRAAAERCGVDHTTIMRVERGNTDSPGTLSKIAEGYGVPVTWLRGEAHLPTDFAFDVMGRPVQERTLFLWDRTSRLTHTLRFLQSYDPATYSVERIAELMSLTPVEVLSISQGSGAFTPGAIERLCTATELPAQWFQCGLVGHEDVDDLLVELTTQALSEIANDLGVDLPPDEIQEVASQLVCRNGAA